MTTDWYAPNQQAVRADESGPAEEGDGGLPGQIEPQAAASSSSGSPDLDAMTKDELLAYAQQLGVSPANAGMTKEELRQGIDELQAG